MTLRTSAVGSLFLLFTLTLVAGCGSSPSAPASNPASNPASQISNPAPLSAANVNLVFVASEDLAHSAAGDINPSTANLTSQGLQRSLGMATFLQQDVLGMQNVAQIYALEPMTHLQTANNYPDMVGLETVQQFAMLNQVNMSSDLSGGTPYLGQSFPINVSYAAVPLPNGVVPVTPSTACPNCRGLDFNDEQSDNETLVQGIVKANAAGSYVFSAPWETVSALLTNINNLENYNLTLPTSYTSPNLIYAISITPQGSASLATFNSQVNPASTYPVLTPAPPSSSCTAQTQFKVTVTGGQNGAVIPAGANTNETLYFIRHADAHPMTYWDNNNYVGAGQWRALDLPNTPLGNINPTQVYSIDPAQYSIGSLLYLSNDSVSPTMDHNWSTVAPALTAEPYAIAKGVPYNLVTSFELNANTPADLQTTAQNTSNFFFTGGQFSNQTVVVAWAFQFMQPTIDALLTSYNASSQQINQVATWPPTDYDTIWTVQLDSSGNVTVSNGMCEGINSNLLPAEPPQF